MAAPSAFPLDDPQTLDDPFPFYRQCRAESPVLFHAPWNAWFVFRNDDITALSRDPRLSASRMDLFIKAAPAPLRGDLAFLEKELGRMIVTMDGEDHHHVQQIVQQGFSAKIIHDLEGKIAAQVDALIGELVSTRSFDASQQLARRLPIRVLAELLGIPESDWPDLLRWAHDFVEYFNRMPAPEEQTLAMIRSGREIMAYTEDLIARRRREPGADFITTLTQAEWEGKRLSDGDILANAILLLVAGNDTVGSALGNAVHLLLTHPDELAKVKTGQVDWGQAFEEVMRYEPTNPAIMRKVAEPIDFAGHRFEAGQEVFFILVSGSRDENHAPDGDRFDVGRPGAGRHMGFGVGAHYCVGAMLARAEAKAFLPRVFTRLQGLRLDPGQRPEWLRTLGVRGPVKLPVVYDEAMSD